MNHSKTIYKNDKLINLKNDLPDGCYFVPLGGVNEIGMNLNVLIWRESGKSYSIIVDAGTGVINNLGFSTQLPSLEAVNLKEIRAIVCTHGHMDHIGALPYILDQLSHVSVYCTKFTKSLIVSSLERNYAGRFNNFELVECNNEFNIGPFNITFINVTHSTPESNMISIKLPNSYTIWHTGDWKFDNQPVVGSPTNMKMIKYLCSKNPVNVLLCDSTNAQEDINKILPTELAVQLCLKDKIKKHKTKQNTVFLCCFSSNVARTTSIIDIAHKLSYKICLAGTSMERLYKISVKNKLIKPRPNVIFADQFGNYPREKVLVLCTGSQAEPGSALQKIVDHTHSYINLCPNDTIIFSSRVIPGNEKVIIQLKNKLLDLGVEILDDPDDCLHVSGHPVPRDICLLLDMLKPKSFIPVHGDRSHLMAARNLVHTWYQNNLSTRKRNTSPNNDHNKTNIIIPYNGRVIKLCETKSKDLLPHPIVVGRVDASVIIVDGYQKLPMSSQLVQIRQKIGTHGIIVIQGNMIAQAAVLPEQYNSELITMIKRLLKQFYNSNNIHREIAHAVYKKYGKNPYVLMLKNKKQHTQK